jgi:hypothetical protein
LIKSYDNYQNSLQFYTDDLYDKTLTGRDFYTKYMILPFSMLSNGLHAISNGMNTVNPDDSYIKDKRNIFKGNKDTEEDFAKFKNLSDFLDKTIDYRNPYIFNNYFSSVRNSYDIFQRRYFQQSDEKNFNQFYLTSYMDDKIYFDAKYLLNLLIEGKLKHNANPQVLTYIKDIKKSRYLEKYYLDNNTTALEDYKSSVYYDNLKEIYEKLPQFFFNMWVSAYNNNYKNKPDNMNGAYYFGINTSNAKNDYFHKGVELYVTQLTEATTKYNWLALNAYPTLFFEDRFSNYLFLANYKSKGDEPNLYSSYFKNFKNDEEAGNEKTYVFESVSSKKLFNFFKGLEANLFNYSGTSPDVENFEKSQKLSDIFNIINSNDEDVNFGLVGKNIKYTDLVYNVDNSALYFDGKINLTDDIFSKFDELKPFEEISNSLFLETKDYIADYIKNSYNYFVIPMMYQDFINLAFSSNISPVFAGYLYSNDTINKDENKKDFLLNLNIKKDDNGNFIIDPTIQNKKTKGLYTLDYLIKDWGKVIKVENPTIKDTKQLAQMILFNVNALKRKKNIYLRLKRLKNKSNEYSNVDYSSINEIIKMIDKKISFYTFFYNNMIDKNGDFRKDFDIITNNNLLYEYLGYIKYFTSSSDLLAFKNNNIYISEYTKLSDISKSYKEAMLKNMHIVTPEALIFAYLDLNTKLLNIATSVEIDNYLGDGAKNKIKNFIYYNSFYLLKNLGIDNLDKFKMFYSVPTKYKKSYANCQKFTDDYYENSWKDIYTDNNYKEQKFYDFFKNYLKCMNDINENKFEDEVALITAISTIDPIGGITTFLNKGLTLVGRNGINEISSDIFGFLTRSLESFYTNQSEANVTENNFKIYISNAIDQPNTIIGQAFPYEKINFIGSYYDDDNLHKYINAISSIKLTIEHYSEVKAWGNGDKIFYNSYGVNNNLFYKLQRANEVNYNELRNKSLISYGNSRNFYDTFSDIFEIATNNKSSDDYTKYINTALIAGGVGVGALKIDIKKFAKSMLFKVSDVVKSKTFLNKLKEKLAKQLKFKNIVKIIAKAPFKVISLIISLMMLLFVVFQIIFLLVLVLFLLFKGIYLYFKVYYIEIIIPLIFTSVTFFFKAIIEIILKAYAIALKKEEYSLEKYQELAHKSFIGESQHLIKLYLLYISFNAIFNILLSNILIFINSGYLKVFFDSNYSSLVVTKAIVILIVFLFSNLLTIAIIKYLLKPILGMKDDK